MRSFLTLGKGAGTSSGANGVANPCDDLHNQISLTGYSLNADGYFLIAKSSFDVFPISIVSLVVAQQLENNDNLTFKLVGASVVSTCTRSNCCSTSTCALHVGCAMRLCHVELPELRTQ